MYLGTLTLLLYAVQHTNIYNKYLPNLNLTESYFMFHTYFVDTISS